jgi:heme/copper-type cytochrome/quinol oxidase subunit 2
VIRLREALVALWVALLVSAPRAAEACSVCTAGREEENQLAFILTTIFLSITPLLMVGGVLLFIVRRIRAAERESAEPPSAHIPLTPPSTVR